jgi:virulence-associated protein VapD
MPVIPMRPRREKGHRRVARNKRVYAISFDLDTKIAEQLCGPGYRACYEKIERVLAEHGFGRKQGSVYFGDEDSDGVACVIAVQELDQRYSWFGRAMKDIRALRVDEDSDLMRVLSNRLRLEGAA